MIGGTLKLIGLLMIAGGALALLGGLAAFGYGFVNEDENGEGLIADPDASEENEAFMQYGIMGAIIGSVALVVGIVLAVVGGSVSRRATRPDA